MNYDFIENVLGDFDTPQKISVAIIGADSDFKTIAKITQKLEDVGFNCWSAPTSMLPGQDVGLQTWKAIQDAQIILLCLSSAFKSEGVHQKLLQEVLDSRSLIPEGLIKVIPVMIEKDLKTPAVLARASLHPVNLLTEDGWKRLRASIELSKKQRPNPEQNYEIFS